VTRTSAFACLVLASIGQLAACSALGLGDYDLVDCDPDPASCEALNEGLPSDACRRYVCSESGYGCVREPLDADGDGFASDAVCAGEVDDARLDCDDSRVESHRGLAEVCDGLDNDCNGWIDESLADTDAVAIDERLPGDITDSLSHAVLPSGVLVVTATHHHASSPNLFETTAIAFDDPREVVPSLFEGQDCAGPEGRTECVISELAIAATSNALIGAGVHRAGCTFGQLRVGAGPASAPALALGEGDSPGLGIDNGDGACSQTADCEGASHPVLALRADEGDGAEGLLAWLAHTEIGRGATTCDPATAFRIALRGLVIDGRADPTVRALASDGPSPLLGDENVSGPPALVGCAASEEDAGYLLAAPAFDRVVLGFLPSRAGEIGLDEIIEGDLDAPSVGRVVVAAGSESSSDGLAVAFSTQRDGVSQLELVALQLDGSPSVAARGPSVVVSPGARLVAGPDLGYMPTGFASPQSGEPEGGWLMLWVESGGDLMGVRVSESGPTVLGVPFKLAAGVTREPFIFQKQLGDSRRALHYGHVTEDGVRVKQATCEVVN
jgi:hypothetical protein